MVAACSKLSGRYFSTHSFWSLCIGLFWRLWFLWLITLSKYLIYRNKNVKIRRGRPTLNPRLTTFIHFFVLHYASNTTLNLTKFPIRLPISITLTTTHYDVQLSHFKHHRYAVINDLAVYSDGQLSLFCSDLHDRAWLYLTFNIHAALDCGQANCCSKFVKFRLTYDYGLIWCALGTIGIHYQIYDWR